MRPSLVTNLTHTLLVIINILVANALVARSYILFISPFAFSPHSKPTLDLGYRLCFTSLFENLHVHKHGTCEVFFIITVIAYDLCNNNRYF